MWLRLHNREEERRAVCFSESDAARSLRVVFIVEAVAGATFWSRRCPADQQSGRKGFFFLTAMSWFQAEEEGGTHDTLITKNM